MKKIYKFRISRLKSLSNFKYIVLRKVLYTNDLVYDYIKLYDLKKQNFSKYLM